MLVRPVSGGDLKEILDIERASYKSPWSERFFLSEMANPISRGLVALDGADASITGYIFFWLMEGKNGLAHINNIAVRPDKRRGGIATALLSRTLREAGAVGVGSVLLEVRPSNTAAMRLYERFGFREMGRRPGYYTDTGEDGAVYYLDLDVIRADVIRP